MIDIDELIEKWEKELLDIKLYRKRECTTEIDFAEIDAELYMLNKCIHELRLLKENQNEN